MMRTRDEEDEEDDEEDDDDEGKMMMMMCAHQREDISPIDLQPEKECSCRLAEWLDENENLRNAMAEIQCCILHNCTSAFLLISGTTKCTMAPRRTRLCTYMQINILPVF